MAFDSEAAELLTVDCASILGTDVDNDTATNFDAVKLLDVTLVDVEFEADNLLAAKFKAAEVVDDKLAVCKLLALSTAAVRLLIVMLVNDKFLAGLTPSALIRVKKQAQLAFWL